MGTLAQRSFAAGEVSPALYALSDQVKFATGLKTCRNGIILRHGGYASRPGTTFVGEVKDSTKTVRPIPFVFNNAQAYVLEFGDYYMRLHQNGAQVTETAKPFSTFYTPPQPQVDTIVAVDAHGYSTGDEIYITGVVGMTELNGRNFKVEKIDTNTFYIKDFAGNRIDASFYGTYISGGTTARIYTLVTPYAYADLPLLKFSESADVVTLTHPSYSVYELSRVSTTSWTLTKAQFAPATKQPSAGVAAGTGGVGTTVYYKVTTIGSNGEESLPGGDHKPGISAISLGATIQVTMNVSLYASALVDGDEVYLNGIVGTTELNGNIYVVSDSTPTTFKLRDAAGNYVVGSTFTAYVSGGTITRQTLKLISGGAASSAAPNVITISVQVGAKGYNIYKSVEGTVYGYIGTAYNMAGIVLWHDIGATPDTTDQPPFFLNPFPTANDQPSCVGMYQQRRCYGNTNNNPEQVQASRSGSFKNFTTSIPGKDDDSVSFTAAGNQVNAVKHLASLGSLIVFTQAGELSVAGDANGALTPSSINLRQHSNCGSSDLRPLIVDSEAVFVQARGNRVRNLRFDWQVNGYRGVDLCMFSDHLLLGYTIVDWAFAQVPNSIIWAVRSDGTLLGFTYLLEQQLAGWHRHDFDGTVENVCVIPESGEDYLYLVIKRSVNGRSVRYIERMASRLIVDIKDYVPSDCSLSFDGRITDGTTATLSGGTNWDYTDTLTLTVNASKFYATDVGQGVILTCADGTILRFTIAGYTSGTVVTGKVNKTVPVASRSVAITTWAKALITIKGLWHLVGKKLSVVGDGLVAASPNNSAYKTVTVSSLGQAALDQMYAVIHAGLPITSDFETLNPEAPGGETMVDKKKMPTKLTLIVQQSRGVFAGMKKPDDSGDALAGLQELKIRGEAGENYDDPVALKTGTVEVLIPANWNRDGSVFVRQVDPVPLTILGAYPAGYYPVRS